jgi:hypothetical protein
VQYLSRWVCSNELRQSSLALTFTFRLPVRAADTAVDSGSFHLVLLPLARHKSIA